MFFNPAHNLLSSQWRGMRVGLFGGSFNPPHEGHLHIARVAQRMLNLDAVWWMVSPGNPLKERDVYEPLKARLIACQDLLKHEPRMLATDIEDALGTHRSFDTLQAIKGCFPAADFVFLMGQDSALNFHKWHYWQDIPALVTLGIFQRPPVSQLARNCPLRMNSHLRHIHLSRSETIPLHPHTCLWLSRYPLSSRSSTQLRKI